MKRMVIVFLLLCSCKSEKKESNSKAEEIKTEKDEKQNRSSFEQSLIDLRDVKQEFISEFRVEQFGISKKKEDFYFYILKLNRATTDEIIRKYSIGAKSFNSEEPDFVLKRSYSPEIKIVDDKKYLFLKIPPTNWRYMDSIDFYIYSRDNWKASGRIGSIKIRDVLFED